MAEWRLFPEGTVPEFTTAAWYEGRERAPHLEQPGHRERLLVTAEVVNWLATAHEIRTVSDLGCGDGGLLSLLEPYGFAGTWGYDLSPEAVRGARLRGVTARQLDVVNSGMVSLGDLAVATEMLEHLTDPHGFARRLREGCRYLVASSPYTETDRDHYEFHAWAWDTDGYEEMLAGAGWRVVRHETVQSFQVVAAVGA